MARIQAELRPDMFAAISPSSDNVIRMLLCRHSAQPEEKCGECVGIDDFTFKKRETYGTIVVDGAAHRPAALLEGRNSDTLKEWLKNNRHVRTVTRDRASAMNETLPDAMQIAD